MRPCLLTDRDMAVLRALMDRRGMPIELLAAEFFALNPFNDEVNMNPLRACEQRLRTLARDGYVSVVRQHDGRRRRKLVIAANAVNGVLGGRASRRRAPARSGAHHVVTQEIVAKFTRSVETHGGRVVEAQFEADLRAVLQRGRRVRRGDVFPTVPDAVCVVEIPGRGRQEIAVEYVTSKYTSADIVAKHKSFARYDDIVWFADRPNTATRVTALTGAACATI
jgi:hypothetical protein